MEVEVRNPFPFEALPRIWRWIEPFRHKISDDFSPQNLGDFVEGMALKWNVTKTWAVYGDGELGGLITFERLSPWLGTAHCIFKPEMQGKGVAVKACRLAVAQMFEEGIGKLAFYPLAGNLAIGSLLINIGAKREGSLEAHTLSGGKPIDMWVYGLKKGDFENAYRNSGRNAGIEPDRRGCVDRGVCPVGQAENQHEHEQHHANPDPSDASADGSTGGLLNRLDEQPLGGPGPDQERSDRQCEPELHVGGPAPE